MKTLNQELAIDVHKRVLQVFNNKDESYHKKYGTMAHKFPILVRTSGLVQAVAFVEAKSKKHEAWRDFLKDVAQSLGFENSRLFLEKSREEPLGAYIYLTRRLLAVLLWYKRFAESLLKVQQGDEDEESKQLVEEVT